MTKRPEKTAQTKADIQEAFWRLYAENPMQSITVAQVCELAGYTRGTFYLHFQDLYQLQAAVEDDFLAGMTACVESCLKRLTSKNRKLALAAGLADVIAYYEQNRRYITVLLGTKADPAFLLRLKGNLKPLWRRYVITDTGDHSERELDLMLEYTLTGTLFMVSEWLKHPGDVTNSQIGHLVYDIAIRDITARAAS